MLKLTGAFAFIALALLLSAGTAAAGCCKTDSKDNAGQTGGAQGCKQSCKDGVAGEKVGTVKAVDSKNGVVVISSKGEEDLTVAADTELVGKLKEGDTVQVAYETKGCLNIATALQKRRPGFKLPAPCSDKKL